MRATAFLPRLICLLIIFHFSFTSVAQSPGGVATGTVRGWKVEHFDGNFGTSFTSFGSGSSNTTPDIWGYTGYVSANEFYGYDNTYFGLQYSGIVEVPQTGSYSFNVYNIDDHATLYIDGVQKAVYTWSGSVGSITATVTLSSGDHIILVKYIEAGGPLSMSIRWSGPGIASNSDLDGRFVRVDNAALAAWYKGSDVGATANYSGTTTKLNSYANKASAFSGIGNIRNLGTGWAQLDSSKLNFNPSGYFDGDDWFSNASNQSGLALRSAPRTAFFVNSFGTNATGSSWLWGQGGSSTGTEAIGMYKNGGTQTGMARSGDGNPYATSTYSINEPKLLTGDITLGTGNTASINNNRSMSANGGTAVALGYTERITNYANAYGIQLGAFLSNYASGAYIPEFIYYPFELTTVQRQKVNTYLAIKYGITLQHNYLNTSGTVLWDVTANTSYNNRIFGIGREMIAEALNQKQSQSQMAGATGNNFLVVSKGSITATNAANTGSLADGDYMIIGDNNGTLTSQNTEIPTSFSTTAGCATARLNREWKVKLTGNPGAVTLRAGASGSFLFPGSAAGIVVMVDIDGDGDFTNNTVNTFPSASVVNGVATFDNVNIPDGAVISFAWVVTAPGGVSSGLSHWLKANDGSAGNMTVWNDQSTSGINLSANSDPSIVPAGLNYNPVVDFDGDDYFFLSSNFTNAYTAGEVFSLGKTNTLVQDRGHMYTYGGIQSGVQNHYTWSNGGIYESFGTNDRLGFVPASGSILDTKTGISATSFTYSALDWNIHNVFSATNNWGVNINGRSLVSTATNTVSFAKADANILIGASPGYVFWGQIPEVMLYSRVLSATEKKQVQTYLAIKYGLTLHSSITNYLASDGTTNIYGYTSHWNNIFGIGRDDCSGLVQKQSKSSIAGDNVSVGLNSIVATNLANAGSFTSNKMFLVIGNDGAALTKTATDIPATYTSASCNAMRYAREWKVKNTNAVGAVQVKIGDAANKVRNGMTYPALAIDADGDGNFATGTVTIVNAANVSGGVATFNNVTLPDGAVFTMCWTEAAPGGVRVPTSGTTISGQTYVNGLQYKLYSGTVAQYLSTLDLNPLPVLPGTQVSNGYLANTTRIELLFTNKINNAFGVEVTGKIYIPSTTTTWQFKSLADDQVNLKIDGVSVLNQTTWNALGTTGAATSLTAGYHDIVLRFGSNNTSISWDLQWNGGSGSTFVAIPDANFFVQPFGPSAWFAADDNAFDGVADATNLPVTTTVWPDMSTNGNDLTLTQRTNAIYKSANGLRNYNQQIRFDDSRFSNTVYLNGFAYGRQAKSMFAVNSFATTGVSEITLSWGTMANNSGQGFWTPGNTASYFGYTNDLTGAAYWSATSKTSIIHSTYQNSAITPSNHARLYTDGLLYTQGTFAGWNTLMSPSVQLQLGNHYVSADASGWNGDIDETIFYPWELSATERQRVNSYLGIKWGITLDQTTATDYLASDGTKIWDASVNASFKYDITGIGRDDCGALYQTQSTSTDGSDIISMGLDSIAINNSSNSNTFANDKSFLIWSHNNGTIASYASGVPASLSSISACYQKVGRVWQAQVTNTPGAMQLKIGKAGYFVFSKSSFKPVLLIGNSATDFTGATVVNATAVVNGIAQFDNITFTNGQYFTFAVVNASPGGVSANLALWLSADDGTDNTTDNTAVTTWSDMSSNGMNGTAVNGPLYRSGASTAGINFNPAINFNGTTQYFNLPTGFNDFTAGVSIFGTYNPNATVNAWARLLHLSAGGNAYLLTLNRNNTTNNIGTETYNASVQNGNIYTSTTPLATGVTGIYSTRIAAGTSGQTGKNASAFVNGFESVNANTAAVPTTISRTVNRVGAGGSATEWLGGLLPELILYNRDLTATERLKVHSYLAIRYGKTLNSSVVNYINTAGNNIYDYSTHWNRITGIGRDDCEAMEQKQSKSVETGALVTISNGNSIAADNTANNNSFTDDKSYAVFGDNNKPITWTGVDNLKGSLVRLNRIWRMKETGTVGTVYIEVPGNSSVLTAKLPAGDAPTDPVYMVISNSGSFKGVVTFVEMMPDIIGAVTKWNITYDFADGDYFTFATKKLCLGPGGITDGLTTWYRADNKTTGAITPTTGTMVDETGNYLLTRNAGGTATITAGSATAFNYNRYLALTGNAVLQKTALSENSVFTPAAGAMYVAAANSSYPFSLSRSGYNSAVISGNGGGWANATPQVGGTFTAGIPNLVAINKSATTLTGGTNGTVSSAANVTTIAANNTNVLYLGAGYVGTTLTYNSGNIGEAFTFNRDLTAPETNVLNTYLAMKYGQTLSHNYFTPDYDGTNAASSTIYDVSTYNNHIFGVGIDSTGCFYQKQSTSQLTGSMLKMSIYTSIAAENVSNAGTFSLDRTYVAAGDDNGAIASWATGTTPAIYNNGACAVTTRVARQWKMKAINNQQAVLITIPDNSSAAAAKLPVLPAGATKVYMVVNEDADFSINASQEELEMTMNATTKEWEVTYTFPDGTYKYVTFVAKPDLAGLQPITIGAGAQDATSTDCNGSPYIYYKGTTNTTKAIIAVNPNGNVWSPTGITINNQGTLTGGGGTFTNTGTGYYQSTDGSNTLRITKRLSTIVAPGSYTLNDGVIARVYYADADTMAMLTDALPGGGTIQRKGWFKYGGDAAATVADMTPTNLPAQELTPVAWGIEQGVKYVEFLVSSFSSFGYFAKTTSAALPIELEYFKGEVISCENVLAWKSNVEQGFRYFELQYGNDAVNFTTVATLPAKGSGTVYQSKHTPGQSKTYYRLKMVDWDGTVKYSSSIALTNNCSSSSIAVYPNPVSSYVEIAGLKPGTLIRVWDARGREVLSEKTNATKQKIKTAHLTNGSYFIEIFNNRTGERNVFKVIKE
ncbi:MAG: T9SS type A sorting domain-containing protein [Chitinophagaceae bacterium]|nr:T9SS type A sorting domain-containing protein [Chitinophagaceae bacterium]